MLEWKQRTVVLSANDDRQLSCARRQQDGIIVMRWPPLESTDVL